MGAWGAGNLDNDAAFDALAVMGEDLSAVAAALDLRAPLDADDACAALAAAEVVAAALGWPPRGAPVELLELAVRLGAEAARGLAPAALGVLDAVVEEDSELRELWDEDPELGREWRAVLADLRARLS